jgi:hypothetical protein
MLFRGAGFVTNGPDEPSTLSKTEKEEDAKNWTAGSFFDTFGTSSCTAGFAALSHHILDESEDLY